MVTNKNVKSALKLTVALIAIRVGYVYTCDILNAQGIKKQTYPIPECVNEMMGCY